MLDDSQSGHGQHHFSTCTELIDSTEYSMSRQILEQITAEEIIQYKTF